MRRLLLALTLYALALAPPARAQSASDCAPDVATQLFGPEPVVDPEPLAPRTPDARPADARSAEARSAERRAAARRAHPFRRPDARLHAAARGTAAECPALTRIRLWGGGGWEPAQTQSTATYDADGRALTITEMGRDGGETPVARTSYSYDESRVKSILYEFAFDGPLEPTDRETYAYDAAGRASGVQIDEWDGAEWSPRYRAAIAAGAGPYVTAFVTDEWNGAAWTPSYRGTFTYTADSRRLVSTYEFWDGAAWQGEERTSWAYDAGRAAVQTIEQYDGTAWVPGATSQFAYDGVRLASRLDRYVTDAGTLADGARRAFAYDGAGRLAEAVTDFADSTGTLRPFFRERFVYDAGGLVGVVFAERDGAAWVDRYRSLFTRDAAGRATERVEQVAPGGPWQNESSALFSYDGTVAAEPVPAGVALALAAGPNPAASAVTFRFALAAPGEARLTLVDALGRTVAVLLAGALPAGAHTVPADVARLAPGVYVARLTAGAAAAALRVSVVR